jgi:hypothetical protein
MTMIPRSGVGALRAGPALGLAMLLSACVADSPQGEARQDMTETAVVQPRHATYNCGENGAITVENMRTAVRLVEPEGDSYELPASPPTQTSRYGEGGLALVVEDREALWMKAGQEPMSCRR